MEATRFVNLEAWGRRSSCLVGTVTVPAKQHSLCFQTEASTLHSTDDRRGVSTLAKEEALSRQSLGRCSMQQLRFHVAFGASQTVYGHHSKIGGR